MVEIDDGSIGPHEGRELELMLSGSKPLSVFVIENPDPDWTEFPEEQFDEQVALGNLLKIERVKQVALPAGGVINIRTVYYSLPKEEWRIHAFMFIEGLYEELGSGYRPDLEQVTGRLLGYEPADIDFFLRSLRAKGTRFAYICP